MWTCWIFFLPVCEIIHHLESCWNGENFTDHKYIRLWRLNSIEMKKSCAINKGLIPWPDGCALTRHRASLKVQKGSSCTHHWRRRTGSLHTHGAPCTLAGVTTGEICARATTFEGQVKFFDRENSSEVYVEKFASGFARGRETRTMRRYHGDMSFEGKKVNLRGTFDPTPLLAIYTPCTPVLAYPASALLLHGSCSAEIARRA